MPSPQFKNTKCAHPDCTTMITNVTTSGMCGRHVHAPLWCQCKACGERNKAARKASARRPKRMPKSVATVHCETSTAANVVRAKVSIKPIPDWLAPHMQRTSLAADGDPSGATSQ